MLADPSVQLQLLDLAALDTTLGQLAHRRRSLPELAVIERTTLDLAGVDDELVELSTARSDLDRSVRRMESDVDAVRQRRERNSTRLTSGAVSNPRDLEALEHEIATLVRRQGELEDSELELMERSEEIDAELAKVQATRATVEQEQTAAISARDETWSQLDAEARDTTTRRTTMTEAIPSDLLGLYDKIRAGGGPGAAAITARRCGGCRMELSGSDLAAIRTAAPDQVLRCESCRCIQVRTPQSGL